jgi:hypothetical protein
VGQLSGVAAGIESWLAAGGALPAGTSAAISQITSLGGYLTHLNTSGVLSLDGLGTGGLPSGITVAHTAISDWATALSAATFAASQITNVLGSANLGADVQAIVDKIANAMGQSGTGHTLANLLTYLEAIPGRNLAGALNTAVTVGGTPLATLVPSGQLAASQIAGALNTAVTVAGQTVATVQSNAQGALDSIVQAAQNDGTLVNQSVATAKSELVSFFSGLHAAFTGGNISSPPAASAADAVLAAGTVQQQVVNIGNGGEESVNVEFSSYSNGAPPAVFTLGTASGTYGIVNGTFQVGGSLGGAWQGYYNAASCLGDYCQVSGVFPTFTASSVSTQVGIVARSNTAMTTAIEAYYSFGSTAWVVSALVGYSTVFQVTFTDTFTPGATYSLVCGDPSEANLYKFSLLKNGTPLALASVVTGDTSQHAGQLYYIDTSHSSMVGGAYRACGFVLESAAVDDVVAMSSFKFQDTTQSQPSVLVPTIESTTSLTYTDLPTTSDEVAVNVGASGKVLVNIYAGMWNNSTDLGAAVAFVMSGANTQAAADNLSIFNQSFTGSVGPNVRIGATFPLTDLNPGLTVFKLKYRANFGGTASFQDRRIAVVALT